MNNIVKNAKQIAELAEMAKDRRQMTYEEYTRKYSPAQDSEQDAVTSIRSAFRKIMAAILGKAKGRK